MTRALVLGGGGVAGAAWEIGILLGLLDAGVDVTNADRFVGTSAGSRVAAQVANAVPLAELFARLVSPTPAYEITPTFDAEKLMAAFGEALAEAAPGVEMYKAVGRYAIEAETPPEAVRRDIIAARLAVHTWPDRDLQVVALDASSGQPRVFTRGDGVDLVDAVAASCAVPGVWPPVTIDGARYIDGGIRSGSNADFAAGCDEVLVITPMPGLPMVAPDVTQGMAALERDSRVVTIRLDAASTTAMGMNPLDPATARPSAEAGRAQAAAHVAEVATLWAGGG